MKQRGDLIGFAVDTRQVRALVQIAAVAGQREIVGLVIPAVLFGTDMFDVEWNRMGLLGKLAVLAPLIGPVTHGLARL